MHEPIRFYHKHNSKIAHIVFNRPEVLNALNRESMERFAQIVDALTADYRVQAVIITGVDGSAFCSGGDLNELSALTTEAEALDFITLMGDALRKLEALPVPVIAAINGYALGGGSEIAMACDIRIVDQNARMGFVQARLALTPGWGAGQRLLQVVGYARAMDLLLRATPLNADNLLALGLANRIAEAGSAHIEAQTLAEQIAGLDRNVVIGIKSLLRAGIEYPYDRAHQIERDIFPPLWAADAHLDAVTEFLRKQSEKRNNAR